MEVKMAQKKVYDKEFKVQAVKLGRIPSMGGARPQMKVVWILVQEHTPLLLR